MSQHQVLYTVFDGNRGPTVTDPENRFSLNTYLLTKKLKKQNQRNDHKDATIYQPCSSKFLKTSQDKVIYTKQLFVS